MQIIEKKKKNISELEKEIKQIERAFIFGNSVTVGKLEEKRRL